MSDPDRPLLDSRGNVDRRYRSGRDLLGVTPRTEDLFADEIDGEIYTYEPEPQCYVCSLDADIRHLVDSMLVIPKNFKETLELITPVVEARGVPESKRPTYWSIRNHQKRHLDFDKRAVRQIVDRRARERGRSMIDGEKGILTAEAVLEVIAEKGFSLLANGEISPSVGETIQAVVNLDKLEKESEGAASGFVLMVQLNALIEAVKAVVPSDMWERIIEEMETIRSQEPAVLEASN